MVAWDTMRPMIPLGSPIAPAAAEPAATGPHRQGDSLHLRAATAATDAGASGSRSWALAAGLVAGLGAEASSRRLFGPRGQRSGRRRIAVTAVQEAGSVKQLVGSIKDNRRLIGFCWLMNDDDLERVVRGMKPMDVEKDEVVVQQGEPGDKFYIIEKGSFSIEVNDHKVTENGPGDSFGELALLYSQPRAATVVASSPGRLWVMDQADFKAAVSEQKMKPMSQKYLEFLGGIPDFKGLSKSQLQQVGRALVPKWYGNGQEMLAVHGDSFEERMYILRAGDAAALDAAGNEKSVYSQPGDVISKESVQAVVGDAPASVLSRSNTTVVLCMSTLTLANILKGCADPVSDKAEPEPQPAAQEKQLQPESEQCVCM